MAAKTIAAYIDLNPVRAGMVKDPADCRWSSYGEAVGAGAKGYGRTAADAALWSDNVAREYRRILMAGAVTDWIIKQHGWMINDRPVVKV